MDGAGLLAHHQAKSARSALCQADAGNFISGRKHSRSTSLEACKRRAGAAGDAKKIQDSVLRGARRKHLFITCSGRSEDNRYNKLTI